MEKLHGETRRTEQTEAGRTGDKTGEITRSKVRVTESREETKVFVFASYSKCALNYISNHPVIQIQFSLHIISGLSISTNLVHTTKHTHTHTKDVVFY